MACFNMQPYVGILVLISVLFCEGVHGDDSDDQCRTLVTRKRCRFPFIYNSTEYEACTGAGHPIGRPWCKTGDGDEDWDYCGGRCPVAQECPPGWVNLRSGCYQVLEVEGGVDMEASEVICAQYGAELMDKNSLATSLDLLEYYRDRPQECGGQGRGYWLSDGGSGGYSCSGWIPDHGILNYVSNSVTHISCNVTSVMEGNVLMQPLCRKRDKQATNLQVFSKHRSNYIPLTFS